MAKLIKNIDSLVTVNADGALFKAGKDMQDIGEIKNGSIIFDDKILWAGPTEDAIETIKKNNYQITTEINAKGKTVLPGFVDSHTHLVFAGNRSGEYFCNSWNDENDHDKRSPCDNGHHVL